MNALDNVLVVALAALSKIGKSKALEHYVNLFSNRLNAECDPCWFSLHGMWCFVLGYGGLGWGALMASMIIAMKLLLPTEHDIEVWNAST